MATVLLYTAPAWVAVISAIFLSELLTKRKTLAVVLAMIGCSLVARVYDLHELQLNWPGILAGLGAVAWLTALALEPTLGSGLAFNAGLRYVPVSSTSAVATLEPVMAALLAFAVFGERLDPGQLFGGALILVAVISLTQSRST